MVDNRSYPPKENFSRSLTGKTRTTQLISTIKKSNPQIITVIGGSHACAFPEECAQSFDFVVIGEGEVTFSRLLNSLEKGESPDFPGLCYLKDGNIIFTGYPDRIQYLDGLWPLREGLPTEQYDPAGSPPVPHGTTGFGAMLGSRGCSHSCAFCSNTSIWADKDCHQPKVIFDELVKSNISVND